jgi:hypothetical protein
MPRGLLSPSLLPSLPLPLLLLLLLNFPTSATATTQGSHTMRAPTAPAPSPASASSSHRSSHSVSVRTHTSLQVATVVYHKSGYVLAKHISRGLSKCLNVSFADVRESKRVRATSLVTPPNLYLFQSLPFWPRFLSPSPSPTLHQHVTQLRIQLESNEDFWRMERKKENKLEREREKKRYLEEKRAKEREKRKLASEQGKVKSEAERKSDRERDNDSDVESSFDRIALERRREDAANYLKKRREEREEREREGNEIGEREEYGNMRPQRPLSKNHTFPSASVTPSLHSPSLNPPHLTSPSSPPPSQPLFLHFVRPPLDLIVSAYLYHSQTEEKWTRIPSFILCQPIQSTLLVRLRRTGKVSLELLDNLTETAHKKCVELSQPYHVRSQSYQEFLLGAPDTVAIWIEAYRALKPLLQMYLNTLHAPPNTISHSLRSFGEAGRREEEAFVDEVLRRIDLTDQERAHCHDVIHFRMNRVKEKHLTAGKMPIARRYEMVDFLLKDHVLGPLLRHLAAASLS